MAAAAPGTAMAVFLVLSCMAASAVALNLTTLSFDDGFSHLFGNENLIRSPDGRSARLTLDRYSGNPQASRPSPPSSSSRIASLVIVSYACVLLLLVI